MTNPAPETPNFPAINLQYRLDMCAAAFRAVLRSSDRAQADAFAQVGLDYATGDEEALAEGAALADRDPVDEEKAP